MSLHPARNETNPSPMTAFTANEASAHSLGAARAAIEGLEPLEDALSAVESELDGLGRALRDRDVQGTERHAAELHGALSEAMRVCTHAARRGGLPFEMRQRLVRASGQVAAQREALARATSSLDRAIDILIPREASPVYQRGFV